MNVARSILLAAAGVSLATLVACSDDEPVVTQTDPQVNENSEAQGTKPGDSADDAMRKLRDGAGTLLEGAGELGEKAREKALQALEDAGPALERAGEIAKTVGKAVDDIVKQALSDFDKGVELLQKRLDEVDADKEPFTGESDAVLAAPDTLKADTKAAARAHPAGIGPDYVGVWAADPAACGSIDQQPVEMFAVITTSTIRRYENVCNFSEGATEGDTTTLEASCIAEGEMEDREILVSMTDENSLTLGTPEFPDAARLTRCRLP